MFAGTLLDTKLSWLLPDCLYLRVIAKAVFDKRAFQVLSPRAGIITNLTCLEQRVITGVIWEFRNID